MSEEMYETSFTIKIETEEHLSIDELLARETALRLSLIRFDHDDVEITTKCLKREDSR